MRPVLTASQMGAVDEAARREVGIEALIERAGDRLFRRALSMLGGSYGRRVVVVCGRGHNGDDGRVAALLLEKRGVAVQLLSTDEHEDSLPICDLVIDAAFGTGFRGTYTAPKPPSGVPVLSVDIPSGVEADTGVACDGAVVADATITFGALKPGLLFGDGPSHAGVVTVEPIGLDLGAVHCHLVEESDVGEHLVRRRREANKWDSAVFVAAGSPLMTGAPALSSLGALRAGAGMVRLGVPGVSSSSRPPEVVSVALEEAHWETSVLSELSRCKALVLGPGLGRSPETERAVRALVAASPVPMVLDADALNALGEVKAPIRDPNDATSMVLTPHDGEYARLTGGPPGPDRIAAARTLAHASGAVVLLKGPTTVVAAPSGEALLVNSGTPRLATAGTGDVLSGVIGALLARGLEALVAAAIGAFVHGVAAQHSAGEGMIASDLPPLVAATLEALSSDR